MLDRDPRFEQFVAETFDSEESVAVVLAVRGAGTSLTPAEVLERIEHELQLPATVQAERPIAEKRIELRLRDLEARGIVTRAADRWSYAGVERGNDDDVARIAELFATSRRDVNRLIYSAASRARKLAEAFRL